MIRHLGHTLAHLFHPRRSNNHRSRLLHPQSYVYFACVIVGFALFLHNVSRFSSELGSILGYSSEITTTSVISGTNAERSEHGLSTLTENQMLATAARAKAADMFAEQYWAHTSPEGKQPWDFMQEAEYRYTSAGENLARDFMLTTDMMDAWMNSPTHRANIVNPNYREIGVAVVNGTLQGVETTLVVQMFGRPQTTEPTVTQAAAQLEITPTSATPAPAIAGEATDETAEADTTTTAENLTAQTDATNLQAEPTESPAVLADLSVQQGSLSRSAVIPPLVLFKSVFLAILILLIGTLLYDAYAAVQGSTTRMVGKNLAHIAFFITIALVIALWKGGVIR